MKKPPPHFWQEFTYSRDPDQGNEAVMKLLKEIVESVPKSNEMVEPAGALETVAAKSAKLFDVTTMASETLGATRATAVPKTRLNGILIGRWFETGGEMDFFAWHLPIGQLTVGH